MRIKFKKLLISILALILMVSNIVTVNASDEKEEYFAGRRQVVYMVTKSDLENFVDGGRSTFDILLRKYSPEWLIYDITAKDRDVYITFEFEFSSFDDYTQKVKKLLTHSPSIVKDDSNDLYLLEGYSVLDFMNFLQSVLNSLNSFNNEVIEKTFKVTENTIEVNSNEYKMSEERLAIRPLGESVIKLDGLEIYTSSTELNTYIRSIWIKVDNDSDLEKISERLEKVGNIEGEEILGEGQIKVTFEAATTAELVQATMKCLNVPVSVSEYQNYVDDNTVGVTCTEFIDLEQVLNEDMKSYYTFEYPECYSNVSSNDENVLVENQKIAARNLSSISYYYERGFEFSSIEIETDLTSFIGKKIRTISFITPTEIGVYYHDLIKEWAQKQMINGTTLNIFDETGNRHYQFVFSSWFWKDIAEFTQSTLNGVCVIGVDETWIPFGKNNVQEKIKVGTLISDTASNNEVSVSYTLHKFSNLVLRELKNDSKAVLNDKSVSFQIENGEKISFSYKEISFIKCIIELLAITFIMVLVLRMKKGIKKKIKRENYCSNCGCIVQPQQDFCGRCGNKLK